MTFRTGSSSSRNQQSQQDPLEDVTELETGGGDMTHTEYGELDDQTPSNPSNDKTRPKLQRTSINQSTMRIKSYLSISSKESSEQNNVLDAAAGDDDKTKIIANSFPHTTVLFMDIVGFTSWSSQRDPEQVFTLLQAVFKSFDKAARKRGVFKAESICDSYVAGKVWIRFGVNNGLHFLIFVVSLVHSLCLPSTVTGLVRTVLIFGVSKALVAPFNSPRR